MYVHEDSDALHNKYRIRVRQGDTTEAHSICLLLRIALRACHIFLSVGSTLVPAPHAHKLFKL